MTDNVISTVIRFTTQGYEKASAALKSLGKTGSVLKQSFATLAMSLGTMGGALGKAAAQAGNFLFAIQNMGAVGGAIAGAQLLITAVCDKITASFDRMVESVRRAGDVIRERLARQISSAMSGVANMLDAATTQAQRQAKYLEALANAYRQVADAKNAAAKSGSDERISAISLEKSYLMSKASSPEEKARIGAAYDVRLAKEGVNAAQSDGDAAVKAANEEADEKLRRYERAASDKKLLDRAQAKAEAELERMTNAGTDQTVIDQFAAKKKEADAAVAAAEQDLIAKSADLDAAEEGVKAALNARKTALNNANRALVEAVAAERELIRSQKEAAKEKAESERKANQAAALERQQKAVSGLQTGRESFAARFADHFGLWRDPAAAQAAQDEAKRKSVDMQRFQKEVSRYGGKWRIDEAARLMRSGDEAGLQGALAQWRKSARFNGQTEQMVLAAASDQNRNAAQQSLDQIEQNTANLDKKLDQLLSLK